MDTFGIVWRIFATLALVGLNGYFVAAEFAAVGARASRLEALAGRSLIARLCLKIKRRVDLYLNTCQLGITLASLGLGAVTEPAVASVVSPLLHAVGVGHDHVHPISFAIALSISTALHVIVGEVAPKNLAIFHPDRVLAVVALPLVIITYLLYPVVAVLNSASNLLLRSVGVQIGADVHSLPHTVEELRTLVTQAAKSGGIDKGHREILAGAFDFGDLKVRQIMTPRTQVDFLTVQQPLRDLLRTIQRSAFTRFPLCDGDVDHVIGLVHMKDLFVHLKLVPGKLRFTDQTTPDGEAVAIADGLPGSAVHVIGSGDIDLRKIKRDVMFVPELTPVPKLLEQFQERRMHLAVVVDEYGATQGIITLEDVIEEIVGDIEDEFDAVGPADVVRDGRHLRVTGLCPLHELREHLPLNGWSPGTDVDTVGGYIIRELGRWPRAGDTVPLGPHTLRVINVQQNRVGHVLIIPAPPATTAPVAGPTRGST